MYSSINSKLYIHTHTSLAFCRHEFYVSYTRKTCVYVVSVLSRI